ncbi:hypothetical protein BOTBODRAFT_58746 [Botryobasidium botryosum FD-172 SS1]|uniref:ABM domain-containing protein n=1 Tax=Botryobasidium botryosum (strain FD-172 SS1) TaxID=930990 RepID=A0A067MBL4_BOTB1|nr:hypothetical protein BOTBODRAFT_58746 [Botryobasidium botryosum FD-172 SS1]
MSKSPASFSGKFIVSAKLEAKPGRADELQIILSQVKDRARSDAEPGTISYRVSRSGDMFLIFEEYADIRALKAHSGSDFFKEAMGKAMSLQAKAAELLFFEEI